jgi:serine protease Do
LPKTYKKELALIISFLALSFLSGYIGGIVSHKNNPSSNINYEKIEKITASNQKLKPAKVDTAEPNSISGAAKISVPAVVHISLGSRNMSQFMLRNSATNIYRPLEKRYFSLGSGIITSRDGYILTNNHVIENLGGNINVSLSDGRKFKAKIIGTDPKTDLAVIKINANNLPFLKFSDSDKAVVGDVVIAIGNPFGIGETVTMGIISAVGRSNIGIVEYENFIQTDAAINPGSSGGALVNTSGELVGINTAILTKSGGYEGIGFAIPSNMAKKVFRDIMADGKVERGWIGAGIKDVNVEIARFFSSEIIKGAVVIDVVKGSPAYISGLQKGDIIISVNNKKIKNKSQLKNDIAETAIGKKVKIDIIRKGKAETLSVRISKLPENLDIFDVNNFTFPNK